MNNILRVAFLAKPYQKILIILSSLIVISSIIQLATPLLTKAIVDQIQHQLTTGSGDSRVLFQLLAITLGINILTVVLQAVSDRLGDATSARITNYLINTFYDRILRLPQSYFDSELSGKILNQLTRGINAIGEFIGAATNFIGPSLIQTVFCIGLLCYYSLPIGLLAITIFPLYILISNYSTKRWAQFETKKNQLEDDYKNRIVEVVQNMKLVKISNNQHREQHFISRLIRQYVQLYDNQSTGYHWLNLARNGVLELFLITIILITFQNTFNGVFTLGTMVLIIQLLNQLRRPLFGMSYMLERIKKAEAGSREFFSIISIDATEIIPSKTKLPLIKKPTISLDNVSFQYAQTPVVRGMSFSIIPGENVAIIGSSGAGKTTLVNLMLELYEPTKGEIRLDDKKYSSLTHAEVRAHFAYVFQDNELFSSTVWENVTYGNPGVTRADVMKALQGAYAADFVKELPKGLDTRIGERGIKLSGGQKQRLQIARALLSPAPILILDEATSSLDAKSESLIQQAFLNLTKQKTVIIIAHRFSTLQHVDRILVIDKGKLVDEGAPGVLAKQPGIFQELLRYQIEGNQKLLAKYDMIS